MWELLDDGVGANTMTVDTTKETDGVYAFGSESKRKNNG